MARKTSHLKTHTPIAQSNWSHQLHFSVHTAEILQALLEKTPMGVEATSLERLIKKELVQTFVHKKVNSSAVKDYNLSSKKWREMLYANKLFVILYQDYKKELSYEQKQKIRHMIDQFTHIRELETTTLPPKILQDWTIENQSLSDVLETIRRIKKQRKLFSAIKTKKIKLHSFIY